MKCPMCGEDGMAESLTRLELSRAEIRVVILHVPAQRCERCGEEYVGEPAAIHLFRLAESACASGAREAVIEFTEAVR